MEFDWLAAIFMVVLPAGILTLLLAVIPGHRLNEIREDIEEDLL